MHKPTLQIQSVMYCTEKENILRTITHLANALRVEREEKNILGRVSLKYGDASPEPIFSNAEIAELKEQFSEYLDLDYHVFGFNSGTAKGHNMLGKDCSTNYIMIMNPDIILSPRTIIELMHPMQDWQVGMVEARQTPIEHHKEYNTETFETEWASTACTIIRTSIFHEINGFDEDTFFMYCDDVDFSWRLRLAGYKIYYQPLAPVYHAKRLSNNGQWTPTKAEIYYSAEAALMMAHKWSNFRLEKQLEEVFENGNETQQEVVKKFKERKKDGKLPTSIDPEHKVSVYHDGFYYAANRFTM